MSEAMCFFNPAGPQDHYLLPGRSRLAGLDADSFIRQKACTAPAGTLPSFMLNQKE